VDLQLQQYLRSTASLGRDVERVGPFVATFDRGTDNPYLNYAIPDDDARPTADAVAALIEAYERRVRIPRLEFLPAAAPEAETALLAGGFTLESRLPLMTCTAATAVALAEPDGIRLERPSTDEDLLGMRAAQNAAFGAGPPDPDRVAGMRESLAAGTLFALARDADTGEIVGGAVASVPGDGVTELAGIGVRDSHRRRGIAGALTARLTAEAFAAGVRTAFLTPGHDEAFSVYARAGYAPTTEMVHIRKV